MIVESLDVFCKFELLNRFARKFRFYLSLLTLLSQRCVTILSIGRRNAVEYVGQTKAVTLCDVDEATRSDERRCACRATARVTGPRNARVNKEHAWDKGSPYSIASSCQTRSRCQHIMLPARFSFILHLGSCVMIRGLESCYFLNL